MMDIHEVVSKVKEMARDLGRTPTRSEFFQGGGASDYALKKHGWLKILDLAGLQSVAHQLERTKLTNSIFERKIEEVLNEHEPRVVAPSVPLSRVLVIGDCHFPFHSQRTLDAIYKFAEREKPDHIIQVGDLYDLYAHSKFPRSQNIYTPVEEERAARKAAEEFWKTLQAVSPNSKCIQIKGNHDIRPMKRTLENLPSLEHVVARYLDELMTFEGVELVSDYREEYMIDNVLYHHGYRTGLGAHRDYTLRNMVVGHTHKGGVVFRRLGGQTIWELNAGFCGDPESKVFGYMPQKTCDYTLGFGFIDEYGPRFIPL